MLYFRFLLPLFAFSFSIIAEETKPVKPPEKTEYNTAVIRVLDKMYTSKSEHAVKIGGKFAHEDLEIGVEKCVSDQNGHRAFLNIGSSDGDIKSWFFASQSAAVALPHHRFDITLANCADPVVIATHKTQIKMKK